MSSYKYALLGLLLFLPLVIAAGADLVLGDWYETGLTLDSLIRYDRATNGVSNHIPVGRTYILKSDGMYITKGIVNALVGDTLRMKSDDNMAAAMKPVVYLHPTGVGTAPHKPAGYFIQIATQANVVVNLKDILISGYYEPEDSNINNIQGAIIGATNAASTNFGLYLDGCIIKTANGNPLRTEGPVHEVNIQNCIFGDMGFLGTSNLGAGKCIDLRNLKVDTCLFKNNTFVNFQDRIVRHYWSTGPLKNFIFENNTVVNGMSYHGTFSLGNIDSSGTCPIRIANNLFVDPYSLGGDTDCSRSVEWDDSKEVDPNFPTPQLNGIQLYRPLWVMATKANIAGANLQISGNYYTISDTGREFLKNYSYYHNEGSPLGYTMNARLGADSVNAFKKVALCLQNIPKLMTTEDRWYYSPTGGNKTKATTAFINNKPPNPNWIYDMDRRKMEYYADTLDCDFRSNDPATAGKGSNQWSYLGPVIPSQENLNGKMANANVLTTGWNLVSVPREQLNYAWGSVYANAFGGCFWYDPASGSYTTPADLELGKGYWAFYKTDETVTLQGTAAPAITIHLGLGWNLLGSTNRTINESELVYSGPGSSFGGLFAYIGGGYVPTTTIAPGQAVWVFIRNGESDVTIP